MNRTENRKKVLKGNKRQGIEVFYVHELIVWLTLEQHFGEMTLNWDFSLYWPFNHVQKLKFFV